MRIHTMTATFGKLSHETLTLQPGLNIIHAPNEWGKSTWCAFLVAMLYGIDTRTHSTKAALSDKERYAPWSGSPMEGRIDLNWNGRDITIERRSKGRAVFGEFKAYETATGLPIPALTAANCGQMLLGVEKSVFLRSGFLRLSDMPVTQDDALRRRLNALVTTGDDSGEAERLSTKLKELKNRCRFNRTGLLPQAEAQRDTLTETLQQLEALKGQTSQLLCRQAQLEAFHAQLENHSTALRYAASKSTQKRLKDSEAELQQFAARLQAQEAVCAGHPSREEAAAQLRTLQDLAGQVQSLQMESQMLPPSPQPPKPPETFRDIPPEAAVAQAREHRTEYDELLRPGPKKLFPLWVLGLALLFGGVAALAYHFLWGWGIVAVGTAVLLADTVRQLLHRRKENASRQRAEELCRMYGSRDPEQWIRDAQAYLTTWKEYDLALRQHRDIRGDLDSRTSQLRQKISQHTEEGSLTASMQYWQEVIADWDTVADLHREHQRALSHFQALQALAAPAEPPQLPDPLTYTQEETRRLISDNTAQLRQLQQRLGNCQGQMEQLGNEETLRRQLEQTEQRIAQLEDTYAALVMAQSTLSAAVIELQRRFAPRISQRARELFCKLTDGRYDRLTLKEDLSLEAATAQEDTLRSVLWRSEGTTDQLYLALRLAVSEALMGDSPLILDDALVRFDDTRLDRAMEILQEEARQKQVILFTCHNREADALKER